jgi:hypothetical protein
MSALKDYTRDESYRVSYAFDLSFDITDPDLDLEIPLHQWGLKGDWSLTLTRTQFGNNLLIHVNPGVLARRQIRDDPIITLNFVKLDDEGNEDSFYTGWWDDRKLRRAYGYKGSYGKHVLEVFEHKWLDRAQWGVYDPSTHRSYRLKVVLKEAFPQDPEIAIDTARWKGVEEGREEGRQKTDEARIAALEQGRVEGRKQGLEMGLTTGRAEGLAEGKSLFPEFWASQVSGAFAFPFSSRDSFLC